MPSYDAFISYASPDRPLAEELFARLTAEGFNVWFDKARLEPGFDWHREIEQGCEQSRVLLPVLTPRWLKSDWTRFETYGAEAIIPLVYEGPRAEVMTPPLERWQPARLDMDGAAEAVWARLFAAIRRCLAEPLPEKAARHDHLHVRPTEYFVGRETNLVQIHEELHRNPRTVLTQGRVRAIAATGGAGKTTLARHYVEKFWRCYLQILWVDCRNGLELEYAELHDVLYPERANSGLKVPEKAQSALHALEDQTQRLLILDNAEDEESILAWVPKAGGCHTLITSRFSGWSAAVKTLHLFVLEKEPAVSLLQRRSGHPAEGAELAACEDLADVLGYLPLALEQAAAYIGKQGEWYGFADYLRQYPRTPGQLLAKGIRRSDEYPDSVAATWLPTVQRLGPGARAVLRLCAFFAATPIPVALLLRGSVVLRRHSARFGGEATPLGEDEAELWVRDALSDLSAYSLAQYDGRTFSFHTLLQTVERINISAADLGTDRAAAVELFLSQPPLPGWQDDQRRHWSDAALAEWRPLLAHGRALMMLGADADPELLSRLGGAIAGLGDWRAALPLCTAAHQVFAAALGEDHLRSLAALEDLGYLQKYLGHPEESLRLFRDSEARRREAQGPEHEDTLRALHNLAIAETQLGHFDEAEAHMRAVGEARKRVLGPDHYDTITSIHDLGWMLGAAGRDLETRERCFLEARAAWERMLGPDNPDTLASLTNLASLLRDKGDLAGAEPLYRRALEGNERALGPAHPETLKSLDALAGLLQAKGDLAGAEPLYQRALEGRERALGPAHRETLMGLNNLAVLLQAKGDLAGAEPLHRRALEGQERALGPAHPHTLMSLKNLAVLLQAKGDLVGAEPLYRRALEGNERALGPAHPETLKSLDALAGLLQANGDLAGAEPLCRRALEGFERVLGPAHPDTLRSLRNLRILVFQGILSPGVLLAVLITQTWRFYAFGFLAKLSDPERLLVFVVSIAVGVFLGLVIRKLPRKQVFQVPVEFILVIILFVAAFQVIPHISGYSNLPEVAKWSPTWLAFGCGWALTISLCWRSNFFQLLRAVPDLLRKGPRLG